MIGLAAFATMLAAATGRTDLLVGTAFAGRTSIEAEESVVYVNTLPLRLRPRPDRSFADLLAEARSETLFTAAHQGVPFDHLVERVRPPRVPDRNPIFQVAFGVQNAPEAEYRSASGVHFRGAELSADAQQARSDALAGPAPRSPPCAVDLPHRDVRRRPRGAVASPIHQRAATSSRRSGAQPRACVERGGETRMSEHGGAVPVIPPAQAAAGPGHAGARVVRRYAARPGRLHRRRISTWPPGSARTGTR